MQYSMNFFINKWYIMHEFFNTFVYIPAALPVMIFE